MILLIPCLGPKSFAKVYQPLSIHPQYQAILTCLNNIDKVTGHQPLLKPCTMNTADPDFLTLRRVLQQLCFLPKGSDIGVLQVQNALKQFQLLCKISPTGLLDDATLCILNQANPEWIKTLKKSAQQWQRLGKLPHRYALTNIPSFELYLINHGTITLTSRVMVGKVHSPTPTFSGFIYSIVLNPTWIVPPSLYKKFKPLVGSDGFYMQNGQLFQSPGPKNHLGQIKFLTKRSDAIILHSTHEPELFSNASRAYSFGCVRVESFVPLAQQILSSENIHLNLNAFLDHQKMKEIHLPKPFPIYVVYHTIWIDQGIIRVFPDIYEKNAFSKKANALKV